MDSLGTIVSRFIGVGIGGSSNNKQDLKSHRQASTCSAASIYLSSMQEEDLREDPASSSAFRNPLSSRQQEERQYSIKFSFVERFSMFRNSINGIHVIGGDNDNDDHDFDISDFDDDDEDDDMVQIVAMKKRKVFRRKKNNTNGQTTKQQDRHNDDDNMLSNDQKPSSLSRLLGKKSKPQSNSTSKSLELESSTENTTTENITTENTKCKKRGKNRRKYFRRSRKQ